MIAKNTKHVNPWVAWPVLLLVATFTWHYLCIPATGQTAGQFVVRSVNPFTNVVVIGAPPGDDYTRLGYRLAVPIVEEDLRRRAREYFDLWGVLLGYSVRFESG